MKLARLFLAVVAVSTLAACTADLPTTTPAPPPSFNEGQNVECADPVPEVQSDGSIVWSCSPTVGSGG